LQYFILLHLVLRSHLKVCFLEYICVGAFMESQFNSVDLCVYSFTSNTLS
jgi:hypothetical protein